jgi:hypothetical protein
MDLEPVPLRFYGAPTAVPPLEWEAVESQLNAAPTYWVASMSSLGHPHPRPVWGVWSPTGGDDLWLTLGSPRIRMEVTARPLVTVHLDSGVEVVIIEGTAEPVTEPDRVAAFITAYDRKYDWVYDADTYGPPTRVAATSVLAWRSGGWAGRDGFTSAGKWASR